MMAKQDHRHGRQSTGDRVRPGRPALDLSSSGDVRSAITQLRANLHRTVPMAELAARAGVSERTLRDHFQRFMGMSPTAYGLRLRLNAVRHELQRWSSAAPIASIAPRYGFLHLGRFSHQYRLAFGETPSATRDAAETSRARAISAPSPRRGRPDILVQHLAAPPALSRLAGLLTERIAIALLGEARVCRPPPSTRAVRQYGLTARYRIEGHLSELGEQLQLIVRLVDAETNTQPWGDAWSGPAADALPLIERATAAVAEAVLPAIRRSESERVKGLRLQDMDAYQLCLRAYPLLAGNTAVNARHALELLHRAIERDPDYALANALAAWGHAQLVMQHGSGSPADDRVAALRFSTRAGMLDQDDAMVLTARSVVHTMTDERHYAGELVTRALARNPRLAWAWERRAWLRAYAGDMSDATASFGRALRLDPATPATAMQITGISAGLFDRGRYDLAARWMRRALEIEPSPTWINRTLAVAYAYVREHGAALESLEALRRYRPDIRVRDVVSAMHFPPEFVARVANGLSDLGLPP